MLDLTAVPMSLAGHWALGLEAGWGSTEMERERERDSSEESKRFQLGYISVFLKAKKPFHLSILLYL